MEVSGGQSVLWEESGVAEAGSPGRPAASSLGLSYAHNRNKQGLIPREGGFDPLPLGSFLLSVPLNAGCCRLTEVLGPRPRPTEYTRGDVTGFTRASRLRFLEKANSIDQSRISETWFVSCTVPASENSWGKMIQWRDEYARALRRQWGPVGWFADWKKEPHEGDGTNHGLPHLHLMFYWVKGHKAPSIHEFREWNDDAWAKIVRAKNFEQHKRVGCRVEKIHSWNGVAFYTAKYFTKLVVDEPGHKTGRIWGRINVDQAREDRLIKVVSAPVGKRARRILRKLQERKRRFWLARIGSKWERVRASKTMAKDSENWVWRSPDERAAFLGRCGTKVKLVRPKVIRTKEIQIWGHVEETGRIEPVSVEHQSFVSSLHFCKSASVLRLVSMLEDQERAAGPPVPPDDGIPF